MRKLVIVMGVLILAGCANNTANTQAKEVEGLCVTGALQEYESRNSEGWLKFRCK